MSVNAYVGVDILVFSVDDSDGINQMDLVFDGYISNKVLNNDFYYNDSASLKLEA